MRDFQRAVCLKDITALDPNPNPNPNPNPTTNITITTNIVILQTLLYITLHYIELRYILQFAIPKFYNNY